MQAIINNSSKPNFCHQNSTQ